MRIENLSAEHNYITTRETLASIHAGITSLSSVINADTITFDQEYLLFSVDKLKELIDESKTSEALENYELKVLDYGRSIYEGVTEILLGIDQRRELAAQVAPSSAVGTSVFINAVNEDMLASADDLENLLTKIEGNQEKKDEETKEPEKPTIGITCYSIHSYHKKDLEQIIQNTLTEVLLDKGFSDVAVESHRTGFLVAPPESDTNVFTIRTWCSTLLPQSRRSRAGRITSMPSSLFDITVPMRYIDATPDMNPAAFPIVVDGSEIGSIGPNYLYLYWSALYVDNRAQVDPEQRIFKNILQLVVQFLRGEISTKETYKDTFLAFCRNRIETEKVRATDDKHRALNHIESHRAGLVEQTRKWQELTALLVHLTERIKLQDPESAKEWERIHDIDKITKVTIGENQLRLVTDKIFVIDERSEIEHEIGRFEILIKRNGAVRFYNLDRRITGFEVNMNGPHIYGNGKACFGNIETAIVEAISKFEISIVLQLVMSFLETANPDDPAGRYTHWWPFKDATKCTICKATIRSIPIYKQHIHDYHGMSWMSFLERTGLKYPILEDERDDYRAPASESDEEYIDEDGE